ncbi:CPBP family intramembrane glutamic endopeptidase [Tumebacillus permanentifrigoris]|uniref:CPBP family intramembrane glutamic endopeptidase n=1 Tax=Tumebacillus permanentifrigoris TaxID=378543 RepID=UPI001FE5F669|nr:CPBP family intramembrane glutamic endopeptidase [Tumebacillus permanentifrigoris]
MIELMNFHTIVLPLVGAYYLLTRIKQLPTTPLLLGLVVWLTTWVQWGSMYGALQGLLYGLATFGAGVVGVRGPLSMRQWWGASGGANWRPGLVFWRKVGLGVVFAAVQVGLGLLVVSVVQLLGGTLPEESVHEVLARSPWPWAVPIAAGLAAGIYEELVYRRLADVWLRRWMPGWGVALLSSLLWAGTHVAGDASSGYVRMVELGLLIGPLSYWFYRRYGLFPSILAHGFYNSVAVLISETFLA